VTIAVWVEKTVDVASAEFVDTVSVTGQMVVETTMVSVTTLVVSEAVRHLGIVVGQAVIVEARVVRTVEVARSRGEVVVTEPPVSVFPVPVAAPTPDVSVDVVVEAVLEVVVEVVPAGGTIGPEGEIDGITGLGEGVDGGDCTVGDEADGMGGTGELVGMTGLELTTELDEMIARVEGVDVGVAIGILAGSVVGGWGVGVGVEVGVSVTQLVVYPSHHQVVQIEFRVRPDAAPNKIDLMDRRSRSKRIGI
jgi:hypothetical protein